MDIRLEIGKSYYKCYEEVKVVKDNDQETSEGLNQIFEVINAKGDTGEIKEILERKRNDSGTENPNSTSLITE